MFNANFKSIATSKNQIQQRIYKLNMSYVIKNKDRWPAFFAIILASLYKNVRGHPNSFGW